MSSKKTNSRRTLLKEIRPPGTPGITKEKVKEKMQRVFAIAIGVLVLILGPFTFFTYQMIEDFKKKNREYRWPYFGDFWVCLLVAGLWLVLERLLHMLTYGFFYRVAREGEDT